MANNNLAFQTNMNFSNNATTTSLEKDQTVSQTSKVRQKLKQLTDELMESARLANRTNVFRNTLLREAYDLADKVLDTFEGWNEKDYTINKGEHGYPFWGKPITTKNNITYCPVVYMFSQDQVTLYNSEFCE